MPFLAFLLLFAQSRADYIGGTLATLASGRSGVIEISDPRYFAFYSKAGQVRIQYDHINEVEYGQKVDRRLLAALVISPIFLLSKSRKHYLTLSYTDDDGEHQAIIFQVDKNKIRPTLVGLEARTGLKIQYQNLDARKAGKG